MKKLFWVGTVLTIFAATVTGLNATCGGSVLNTLTSLIVTLCFGWLSWLLWECEYV